MNSPWEIEKTISEKGYKKIAGLDEAGRGPLAGPVVSAAVILPFSFYHEDICDSKKLTSKKRDLMYDIINENAISVGIGIVDSNKIDKINILQASLKSMKHALTNLKIVPDYLLIDGKFTIKSDIDQEAIIKGDQKSISIAAASIIAKVTRDRIMNQFDKKYPQYGFCKHKGYGTKFHMEAISKNGICPIHRTTFKGVKEHLCPSKDKKSENMVNQLQLNF